MFPVARYRRAVSSARSAAIARLLIWSATEVVGDCAVFAMAQALPEDVASERDRREQGAVAGLAAVAGFFLKVTQHHPRLRLRALGGVSLQRENFPAYLPPALDGGALELCDFLHAWMVVRKVFLSSFNALNWSSFS
jgi:hypothetical protein